MVVTSSPLQRSCLCDSERVSDSDSQSGSGGDNDSGSDSGSDSDSDFEVQDVPPDEL